MTPRHKPKPTEPVSDGVTAVQLRRGTPRASRALDFLNHLVEAHQGWNATEALVSCVEHHPSFADWVLTRKESST